MTTHWAYLVNDRNGNWGYVRPDKGKLPAVDFFSGAHAQETTTGYHVWTLSPRLKDFHAGDVIWARATLPLTAFFGCGTVITEPEEAKNGSGWTFHVVWDSFLCRQMAADPFAGIGHRTIGASGASPSCSCAPGVRPTSADTWDARKAQ